MQNKLLEKVDFLVSSSDNTYNITLQIANLSKKKKNIEDLSSSSNKDNNIIVETINEIFERHYIEKKNFL